MANSNYPVTKDPSSKPILWFDPDNPAGFKDLADTILSYVGHGGKLLMVRLDETGIGLYEAEIVPDKNFVHTQTMPAKVWTVTHSLNKYPSVQIILGDGTVIFSTIKHLSVNQVEITFMEDLSGIAVFN